MKRKIKTKKVKLSKAELILVQYKELCAEKKEGQEGYRLSLKDAKKRVEKVKGKKALGIFLKEIDLVIFKYHLQNYFPYSQAFHLLKEFVIEKMDEIDKTKKDEEDWKNSEEYIAE